MAHGGYVARVYRGDIRSCSANVSRVVGTTNGGPGGGAPGRGVAGQRPAPGSDISPAPS